MTTTIFAKNVKDLAEIMLRDTTEDKTSIKYSIQSSTYKIYADLQAGKVWRDARLSFNCDMDWDTYEERNQKLAEWESENPEPQNIIFTSWWLDYQSSKWCTERIVYLSPELGQQIDNDWTTKWNEFSRTSENVGTVTMATILKRLGVETKHLIRDRKAQLKQEQQDRINDYRKQCVLKAIQSLSDELHAMNVPADASEYGMLQDLSISITNRLS